MNEEPQLFSGIAPMLQLMNRVIFEFGLERGHPGDFFALYHHEHQLRGCIDLAIKHYMPITLQEDYMRNTSMGTPFQKWCFYINKDFARVDKSFRRCLLMAAKVWKSTIMKADFDLPRERYQSIPGSPRSYRAQLTRQEGERCGSHKMALLWMEMAQKTFCSGIAEESPPRFVHRTPIISNALAPDGLRFLQRPWREPARELALELDAEQSPMVHAIPGARKQLDLIEEQNCALGSWLAENFQIEDLLFTGSSPT